MEEKITRTGKIELKNGIVYIPSKKGRLEMIAIIHDGSAQRKKIKKTVEEILENLGAEKEVETYKNHFELIGKEPIIILTQLGSEVKLVKKNFPQSLVAVIGENGNEHPRGLKMVRSKAEINQLIISNHF